MTALPAGESRRVLTAVNARWVPENWGGKVTVTLTDFAFSEPPEPSAKP